MSEHPVGWLELLIQGPELQGTGPFVFLSFCLLIRIQISPPSYQRPVHPEFFASMVSIRFQARKLATLRTGQCLFLHSQGLSGEPVTCPCGRGCVISVYNLFCILCNTSS